LANPVGVENFHVRVVASDSLFGDSLDTLAHGDFANTSLARLTLHVYLALAQTTTANPSADDGDSLLGLVTETTSRIQAGRTLDSGEYLISPPLRHAVATVLWGEVLFWALPRLSNMLIQATNHSLTCKKYPGDRRTLDKPARQYN
jgi:hypothetical protein